MTRTIVASTIAVTLLAGCPATDDPTTTGGGTTTTPPTPTTTTSPTTPTTPFDAFDEADLTDPQVVAGLSAASAVDLFSLHSGIIAEAASSPDPKCPLVEVDAKTTSNTFTGGCTATTGVEWFGSAAIVEDKKGNRTVTFSGFGNTRVAPCTKKGELTNERLFTGTFALASDLSVLTYATSGTFTTLDPDACTAETRNFLLDYVGTTSPDAVWAGAGTYGDDLYGRAAVETFNQVSDTGACLTESLTGITTLATSSDNAILLYDGSVDCDIERTAKWLLNGVSQGEVADICCAVLSNDSGGDGDSDDDGVQDDVDNCPSMSNGPKTPARTPDADGWLQDWLTFGPVTGTTSPDVCLPSLDELSGGDAQLAPEIGTLEADGRAWVAALGSPAIFDFLPDFGFVDPAREVYTHVYVYSASARDVTLSVGADDGVRAWVEGATVLDVATCQGVYIDQFQASVSLIAGWNRLTLKVRDQGGGWGMAVRFLDNGVPVSDLELSLSADGVLDPQSDLDADGLGDVCDPTPAG
jgi:hypothetical protein